MDEIDLKLFEIIAENPRCSYRDMADELGISTPAVHRRIQAAREQDILIGPIAMLNRDFAQGLSVVIWGNSGAKNHAEVMEGLKGDEYSQIVTMMSGNKLLFRSVLKSLDDLDGYVSLVMKAGKMADPVIGLSPKCTKEPQDFSDVKVTKVDVKIMSALAKDGRMSVSDISEMIKVSPKTVRNHLKKIMDNQIVELVTIINQAHSGNFVPFMVIKLKKGADKKAIMAELKNNHSPPMIEFWRFSNLIDTMVAFAWVQDMAQMRKLQADLENIDGIESIVSDIFIQSCGNCTWLQTMIADPEKTMKFLEDKKLM